jgi:hypothetical protein
VDLTRAILTSAGLLAGGLFAQPKQPFQAKSESTLAYSITKEGQPSVEITNIAYEMTGEGIPGLPREQRLILRKTSHTTELVGDIGMEASTTVEAWPLGVEPKQKPLYMLTVSGVEPKTVNSELLVISRGLEEVQWWSVYTLGRGAHLFDTFVPLVQFSIGREFQELRYAGLEVPPDDAKDPRLRAPNVIAVLTYSSADHVLREVLITCEDRKLAQLLRSYADTTRKVMVDAAHNLTISMGPSHTVKIPVATNDLDVAHASGSPALHLTSWKR